MDFNAFVQFCSDNGLDASTVEARRAFEESLAPQRRTRTHTRKSVELLCIADGSTLFKRASVPNIKSQKEHTAWVLTNEALMAGHETARILTVGEEIEVN